MTAAIITVFPAYALLAVKVLAVIGVAAWVAGWKRWVKS